MGFNKQTGPLLNTFFTFKLDDNTPAMLLTAHHVVAGKGTGDDLYRWDELADKLPDAWLWSIDDDRVQTGLGRNIAVRDARILGLDLAAYLVPEKSNDLPFLRPSATAAAVGDSVILFSKLKVGDGYSLLTPAVVIYASDSIMIYELQTDKPVQMAGTSGSPVLNTNHEVISNSYGGMTIRDSAMIETQIAPIFPLIRKLHVKQGKTYGIGVPIKLISESLYASLKEER
ncbi:MAG: serine protease [Chryseolinea sp.]